MRAISAQQRLMPGNVEIFKTSMNKKERIAGTKARLRNRFFGPQWAC